MLTCNLLAVANLLVVIGVLAKKLRKVRKVIIIIIIILPSVGMFPREIKN